MKEIEPRDPRPGVSFGVARELISSYLRAVELDERITRASEASQYEAIEQARAFAVGAGRFTAEFAERSLTAGIATTLGLHEAAASALLHEAEALVHDFPATLACLGDGAISRPHVRILLSEAWSLPDVLRGVFEAAALPLARELAVPKFRREARKLRERLSIESIAERVRLARDQRSVTVEHGRDGMSWLTLYLPSVEVAKIAARLDFMGRRTATGARDDVTAADSGTAYPGTADPRSPAQRQADIASKLLQHGTIGAGDEAVGQALSRVGSVRPTVFVTVPALTLLGKAEAPGTLEGVGPIDPDTARELAGEASSFYRILTHPETGTWMSYGRDAYKVPADLQRFIRLRDGTCRFPGCTNRATTGQFDHTIDWQDGGHTSATNIASLCMKHHRLKHNSDWQLTQLASDDEIAAGTIEWTSPAGRIYRTRPDSSFGSGSFSDDSFRGGSFRGDVSGIPAGLLTPRPKPQAKPRLKPRRNPKFSPDASSKHGPNPNPSRNPNSRPVPSHGPSPVPLADPQPMPQRPPRAKPPRRPDKRDQSRGLSDDDPPF